MQNANLYHSQISPRNDPWLASMVSSLSLSTILPHRNKRFLIWPLLKFDQLSINKSIYLSDCIWWEKSGLSSFFVVVAQLSHIEPWGRKQKTSEHLKKQNWQKIHKFKCTFTLFIFYFFLIFFYNNMLIIVIC